MKLAILLLSFGCLIALPAMTQVKVAANDSTSQVINTFGNIPSERKFAIVEFVDSVKYNVIQLITNVVLIDHDGQVTKRDTQTDTATLYLPSDGVTKYIGTTTWHTNAVFDTTWMETAKIDDPSREGNKWTGLVNIALAPTTNKPELLYNKSFSYVKVVSSPSSASITVPCDRLEFYSELFPGHGNIKIYIDGELQATLFRGGQPYGTDFARMIPAFSYTFPKENYNSPARQHTLKIETDAGNQYIIDMIRTLNYTLTPRKKN